MIRPIVLCVMLCITQGGTSALPSTIQRGGDVNSVFIDGKTISLVREFPDIEIPRWINEDKNLHPLNVSDDDKFKHLMPQNNVRFFRVFSKTSFTIVAEMDGRRTPVNAATAGKFFLVIDSAEKAAALVRLSVEGMVFDSASYKHFVAGCQTSNPAWIKKSMPPFTGIQSRLLDGWNDLYLVSLLVGKGTSITAERYVVDEKGHISPVDQDICIEGPIVFDGGTSVSDEELKFDRLWRESLRMFQK